MAAVNEKPTCPVCANYAWVPEMMSVDARGARVANPKMGRDGYTHHPSCRMVTR